MKKEVLEKNRERKIDLEYDEKRYDIEYVQADEKIILRRLSDNKVIKIFNDDIGFIVQVDKEEKTHFVVSTGSNELNHYIDDKQSDSLSLRVKWDCGSASLKELRLSEGSFLVLENDSIYNLNGNIKSFSRIYNDDKVKQYFDDNTILVSDEEYAKNNWEVKDTITYGINPETFEIVTPIWSEDQQRYISVYSEEDLDKMEKNGIRFDRKDRVGDITIKYEIKRYLNERAIYTDKSKDVYPSYKQVDEEFVRSFIKKQ